METWVMPFNPEAIANYFWDLAEAKGEKLSPMKVQKLVYYAHGWCLALTDQPLINEQIEAWKFGPVIPSLYRALRHYGNAPITAPVSHWVPQGRSREKGETEYREVIPCVDDRPEDAAETRKLLDRVWEIYGKYSAVQLSNATHEEGTPWHQVFEEYQGEIPRRTDIPSAIIKAYFQTLALPKASA